MPKGVTENKTGKEGFFLKWYFTFSSSKLRWIGLRGPVMYYNFKERIDINCSETTSRR
jgi:hypothetical protein